MSRRTGPPPPPSSPRLFPLHQSVGCLRLHPPNPPLMADLDPPQPPHAPNTADEALRVNDAAYATEHYDDAYYDWILKNKTFRSHHLRMDWIKEMVDPRPGDRIVDLGC